MKYIPAEDMLPHKSKEFREAFYEYVSMRIKIKKPIVSEYAAKLVINKLAAVKEKTAIESLNKAIENNWISVYPEDAKQGYGFI